MNSTKSTGGEPALTGGSVPRISIVIATFDRPQSLARCLSALLHQRCSHSVEIIVVDNHPQSGLTPPLAEQFASVIWRQESAPGLSRARNRGILLARGEIIVTTDDDVIAPPEWLERLTVPLLDTSRPCLAATTGNCVPWKLETEAERLFEAYGGLGHGNLPAMYDARWMRRWRVCFPQLWRIGTTANAAFRASLFQSQELGLFETRLGAGSAAGAWEDLYMFYRILSAGYRMEYLPDAEVAHAHREDQRELERQLCAYRRGETSFLTLMLLRHHDVRAAGQMLFWIPWWRCGLLAAELRRRVRGTQKFPLRLLLRESLAYLAGPWALFRSR